jgi:glyoxylase-like metal-dependent hydrolase (beta-lactamase superfamily II)
MPVRWGILTLLPLAVAQAQDDVKLNMRRPSERVLVTWGCDYFQGTIMAVLTTDEGLVVIETGLSPSTVKRQRQLVEAELGRRDFRYLINTHMHNDHAFANEVFPEATVVGPEGSVAALRREVESISGLLERLRRSRDSYQEAAAHMSPDSVDGRRAREGVAAFGIGIADLERGITPRYPTLTFNGRHALTVGGLRIEMFEFQGLHSDSDILILVPAERMLFTGDVFWGGRLPVLNVKTTDQVQRLLEHWKAILDGSPDLEFIIPGHSDVPLTVEQFRGMYAYLSRLWTDVNAARDGGVSLMQFLSRNVFAERYPEVATFRHTLRDYNLHQHNIYVLWNLPAP